LQSLGGSGCTVRMIIVRRPEGTTQLKVGIERQTKALVDASRTYTREHSMSRKVRVQYNSEYELQWASVESMSVVDIPSHLGRKLYPLVAFSRPSDSVSTSEAPVDVSTLENREAVLISCTPTRFRESFHSVSPNDASCIV